MTLCVSAIGALLALSLSAAAEPDFSALDRVVRDELKSTGAPGAAVGIVQDDRLVFAKGFGVAGVETGEAVTPRQLFRLGSTTKVFTAATVVSLARDGKLKLDEPLAKRLPRLPDAVGRLTAHQLLTHTSGLADVMNWYGPHDDSALGAEVRSWTGSRFFTEPGRIYSYSNSGYWAAGLLAEEVAGKPFADAVRERLFAPLGMKRTTFRPTVAMTYPLALGHDVEGGEASVVRPFADNAATWPAGSMFSNVEELSRFVRAMLNEGKLDGEKALDAELVRLLTAPHVPVPGGTAHYGYGLRTTEFRGQKIVEHGGSRSGYGSLIRLFPEKKAGVILLINSTGGRLPKTAELASELAAGLPAADAKSKRPPAMAIPDSERKRLAGTYRSIKEIVELVEKDGEIAVKHGIAKGNLRKLRDGVYAGPGGEYAHVAHEKPAEEYLVIGGRSFKKDLIK